MLRPNSSGRSPSIVGRADGLKRITLQRGGGAVPQAGSGGGGALGGRVIARMSPSYAHRLSGVHLIPYCIQQHTRVMPQACDVGLRSQLRFTPNPHFTTAAAACAAAISIAIAETSCASFDAISRLKTVWAAPSSTPCRASATSLVVWRVEAPCAT